VASAPRCCKLTPYLDRTPLSSRAASSSAQRSRVRWSRMRRLVLLDEPLANLDYKLREELRAELPRIFAETGAIFVYATTEPHEALLLGGNRRHAVGRPHHCSSARPIEVFRKPDLITLRGPSPTRRSTPSCMRRRAAAISSLMVGRRLPVPALAGMPMAATDRLPRPPSRSREAHAGAIGSGQVSVTEITGSESFVHLNCRRRALGRGADPACASSSRARPSTPCSSIRATSWCSMPPVALRRTPRHAPQGGEMARIDLDLAHAYKPNPKADRTMRCCRCQDDFEDGGAYALLGPSGCGKTTLLNIISGLLRAVARHGAVRRQGRDAASRPQERNIAQVFQFPVIYDTMTVARTSPSRCATASVAGSRDRPRWRDRRDARPEPPAQPSARGPHRRPEAEDLAGPRPGALGRRRRCCSTSR
jgi:ABC-type sugar transport system ATPase subunit